MCKFTSTIFLQEVFHNCVHPQEVANKKTPWYTLILRMLNFSRSSLCTFAIDNYLWTIVICKFYAPLHLTISACTITVDDLCHMSHGN